MYISFSFQGHHIQMLCHVLWCLIATVKVAFWVYVKCVVIFCRSNVQCCNKDCSRVLSWQQIQYATAIFLITTHSDTPKTSNRQRTPSALVCDAKGLTTCCYLMLWDDSVLEYTVNVVLQKMVGEHYHSFNICCWRALQQSTYCKNSGGSEQEQQQRLGIQYGRV